MHDAPVLEIWESVVVARHEDVSWRGLDIHRHVGVQPELSPIDGSGIIQGVIHWLATGEVKGQDLAGKAVIERISSSDTVPLSRNLILVNVAHNFLWVSASSVVERSGRWKGDAFMLNIKTVEHIIEFFSLVAEGARERAHLIIFGALARAHEHVAASGVSDAGLDLACAMTSDACGVLDWQVSDLRKHLNEAFVELRRNANVISVGDLIWLRFLDFFNDGDGFLWLNCSSLFV